MTLRTTLTAVITGVGTITIGVALALMYFTSALDQAGATLGDATERVRLLMELESYALKNVHQTADADSRATIAIIDRLVETSEPNDREQIQSSLAR